MKSVGFVSVTLLAAFGLVVSSTGCVGAPDELDEGMDGAEVAGAEPVDEPVGETSEALTVEGAVTAASCGTAVVNGLSLQIIAEGNCITPGAYASVPARANLSIGSGVYLKLETPAKNALVAALDASPSTTMTVNSMLRTVAQQYLLYRWWQQGKCGIQAAATPGNSNHETGLALDVGNYSTWTSKLQARGFSWAGSSDLVHFDYTGSGAVSYKGLDVKAFQRLWNRNHSSDPIGVDGIWGPQTQARMQQSPTTGFATGAACLTAAENRALLEEAKELTRKSAVNAEPEHVCGADIHDIDTDIEVEEALLEQ